MPRRKTHLDVFVFKMALSQWPFFAQTLIANLSIYTKLSYKHILFMSVLSINALFLS